MPVALIEHAARVGFASVARDVADSFVHVALTPVACDRVIRQ
jgi:hypothetical protein